MTITLTFTELEIKKLDFCIDNYLNINSKKLCKLDHRTAIVKIIKESIHTQYKRELDYLNQGEDHDGVDLTSEII